jgi:hypothetical protein
MLIGVSALAQQSNDIQGDTLIVVKAYEPTLRKADKLSDYPVIQDTQKVELDFNYEFVEKQLPVQFQTDTIKAAQIKGEPLVKLYRGYVRMGVGNNTTPLFEVFYNSVRSKKNNFGVHARHFSSNGINKIKNSDFSQNELDFYGKKMTKKHSYYAGVDVGREHWNYYALGSGSALPFSLGSNDFEATDQTYLRYGFRGLMENLKNDSTGFNYEVGAVYRGIRDDYNTTEGNVVLSALFKRKLDNGLVGFLDVGVDNNGYETKFDSTKIDVSNTIVKVQPRVKAGNDKWHALAGAAFFLESQDKTEFRYNLMAELKVNLIEEILIPYAGVKGGVDRNNYYGFTKENPFVESSLTLVNSFQEYNLYGGLRGSFSSRIAFNASLSQSKVENMPFYVNGNVNDLSFSRGLGVVYDDVDLTTLSGELSYQNKEKIKLFLIGELFDYQTDKQQEAWHKPNYRITLSGQYDLRDKIVAKLDVFAIGQQKANVIRYSVVNGDLFSSETVATLKGIVDVNLGLEYRYTKKVAAFVQFNNIASVKYSRWLNYPTQQFNVLGGLRFSF